MEKTQRLSERSAMKFSVEDYCSKLGWYLVTIPAGTKGPTKFGWQQPEKALSDPEEARKYYEQNPTHNVGLLHGASGTCAIDIDNVEHTKMIFDELGIDFSLLMNSAPQIIGRENRGKLLFKAPPDLGNAQDLLASPRRSTQDRSGLRASRWICARCPAALNPPRHWQAISVGRQVNLGWPSRSTPAATHPLGRVGSLEAAAHGHLPLEENAKLSAAKQNQTQG
jgi:hypothetical protein